MINIRRLRVSAFVVLCAIALQGVAAHSENDLLEQLRADYTALKNANAEFEKIENNGSVSKGEKADYAAWIQQLDQQFADSCRKLSLHSIQPVPADIPCTESTASNLAPAGINIETENSDTEKTAAMVGQFNDSLGEFDEKLLREQDRVKADRPRTASSDSGGGGAAGESGGESGGRSDNESGETPSDGQSTQQGQQSASGARGSPPGGNKSSAPDDIPDGSDDDVIARQLREAAEKETDPELQKKLWEEYRRYKNG